MICLYNHLDLKDSKELKNYCPLNFKYFNWLVTGSNVTHGTLVLLNRNPSMEDCCRYMLQLQCATITFTNKAKSILQVIVFNPASLP